MREKYKRFITPRDLWKTGTAERWLEEKALEGWWPVDFSGWYGKFQKTEPRSLRFRLEPVRGEVYQIREERRAAYEEMDWHYAAIWLGDYEVWYCENPAAPELYTDLESRALAWDRHLRKLRRNAVLSLLFWLGWAVWYGMDLGGNAQPLRNFLYGMYLVWLYVLLVPLGIWWDAVQQLRGIRRIRQQLEAGVTPGWESPAENIHRRKCRWGRDYSVLILIMVMFIAAAASGKTFNLTKETEPLPYVSLMELDGLELSELDGRECRSDSSFWVSEFYTIQAWTWDGPGTWARYDQLRFDFLAKPLYEEQVAEYLRQHPKATVEELEDSRFEKAALFEVWENDGFQAIVARKGERVFCQHAYRINGSFRDHLDDFAALMEEG